jgi:hypothetical protein
MRVLFWGGGCRRRKQPHVSDDSVGEILLNEIFNLISLRRKKKMHMSMIMVLYYNTI